MNGLSDNAQGILTLISMVLIAVGSASVPAGLPWQAGLGIALVGAIGLGIKEFLGIKKP